MNLEFFPQYFLKILKKYISFRTNFSSSFKIIHFMPFLFQKHIYEYLYIYHIHLCIMHLTARRGGGVKAFWRTRPL